VTDTLEKLTAVVNAADRDLFEAGFVLGVRAAIYIPEWAEAVVRERAENIRETKAELGIKDFGPDEVRAIARLFPVEMVHDPA
jgi:hypothetical protein